MKRYPRIGQLRNAIRDVKYAHDYQGQNEAGDPIYQHKDNYPILKFQGTIKLHGTNSSVVKYADGRIEFQSRERILSADEDNAGFMCAMIAKNLDFLFAPFSFKEYVAIYGEWCGGDICKGAAISGLEKMFVIFDVVVDDEWVSLPKDLHANEISIYNIFQFPTFDIEVDINQPEIIQNKIVDLTIAVEELCPVGKFFGKQGVGEGIVFTCVTDRKIKFKSKGEKHSTTKVKTLNSIDPEMMANINEFVELTATENRLKQGLAYFKENNIEIEAKNTGQFLSWVVRDILYEEADTLEKSGLDEKKVKNAIVTKARMWFLNNANY